MGKITSEELNELVGSFIKRYGTDEIDYFLNRINNTEMFFKKTKIKGHSCLIYVNSEVCPDQEFKNSLKKYFKSVGIEINVSVHLIYLNEYRLTISENTNIKV